MSDMQEDEANDRAIVSPTSITEENIKASMTRWYILMIISFCFAISAFQWPQYTIIADITEEFYNVSAVTVEWTAVVYSILYPLQVIPVCYFSEKVDLRYQILFTVFTTASGNFIKIFSVRSDLIYLVLIGQILEGSAQVFIGSLPVRVAAVWFKANEVSTANSICIFCNQIGLALGFLLLPLILHHNLTMNEFAERMQLLCYIIAAAIAPLVLAVIVYLPSKPKLPPNRTQLEENCHDKSNFTFSDFVKTLRELVLNKNFLMLCVSSGINFSIFYAVGILLNQIILYYFANAPEKYVGIMGMIMTGLGTFGSLLSGVVLDRTLRYKETSIIIYILTCAGMASFIISLELRCMTGAFIAITMFGFFASAFLTASIEFAIELTFSTKESTISLMLLLFGQVLTTIFILMGDILIQTLGILRLLIIFNILEIMGLIITIFIPNDTRRQKVLQGKATVNEISVT